jgi:hypothetical protein
MLDNIRMQGRNTATFLRYNQTVWVLAWRKGKSRGIGLLIAFALNAVLLAIQVSLSLYPAQTVAPRWASVIAVQLGSLLLWAIGYVWYGAWRHYATAQDRSEALKSVLVTLTKVQLLVGLVAGVHNELVQLAKTGGTPARPLGYNSIPFVNDRERWNPTITKLAIFQERYKLMLGLFAAASLIVRDPVPPNDRRFLLSFPNEAEYADVCSNMAAYSSALRAYAASLEDEAAKLTTTLP